ncbi:MAG: hypothetical protein LUI12_01850 [Clostridiales bacterium]|nr:hypothetical protein [Clostridiales bacterium]
MRTARNLKQNMYYSLQGEETPVYETDDDGNIKYYIDDEGNEIPLETGETKIAYGKPVEMQASISFSSGEVEAQEYGLSVSDYDSTLITEKDAYPLTETSLIWYGEEPQYTDDDEVNPKSATFQIVAVKPSIGISKYLLKRVTK